MDPSDSDYFESADEDFQSEEEESSKTIVTPKEQIAHKTQTKNLDKECEENDLKTETLGDNTKITNNPKVEVPKNNKVDESTEETSSKEKNKVKSSSLKLNKKDYQNKETKSSSKEVKKEPADDELQKPKEVKQITNSPPTANKTTPKEEENLWDDFEIDWEQESQIQSKIQTQKQQNSVKETLNQTKEDENLWDDSEIDWGKDSEKITNEESPKPENQPQQNNSWSSWGGWGVTSILTTATQSVSTLTQGISTALESGIGVPDPEELARLNKQKQEKKLLEENPQKPDEDNKNMSFGLNNLVLGVSHLTKLMETTGTKVISGGLDTLETIGKKTMEVLQEGDPGLKKKRAFLKIDQDKPVLSQVLREAKEKAEQENKILEQKHFSKKAKNYETLFDDHQGLVHLEALEMLSKQCDIKLQNLLENQSGDDLIEMQETLDQVKELSELPDEEDDEQNNFEDIKNKLESAVGEINVPISYKRLIETWEETEEWLNNLKLEICDERELHQQAIENLAQLTAFAVEQFHKTGELLLVKEHRSTADEADSLVQ